MTQEGAAPEGPMDLDSFDTSYTPPEEGGEIEGFVEETPPKRESRPEETADPKTETVEREKRAKAKESQDRGDRQKAAPKAEPREDAEEEGDREEQPAVRLKVKVKGAEEEVTQEDLIKFYQRHRDIEKVVSRKDLELKQQQQTYKQFIDSLQQDPRKFWKVAERLGHDPEQLATELLEQRIRLAKMTPEQREAMQAKEELEALRAREQQRQIRERELRLQQETADIQRQMVSDWSRELQHLGIEPTPDNLRTAAVLAQQIQDTEGEIRPSHAKRIAEMVQQFYGRAYELPIEELVKRRGKELEEHFRERLAQSRSGVAPRTRRSGEGRAKAPKQSPREDGYIPTTEDVMEEFGGFDGI